ncbi:MAG: hypothetical protein ACYS0D_05955, partial [Planctomycetota bacterium]
AAEPPECRDPSEAFDRLWAAAVFSEAIRMTEQLCRDDGMSRQWRAFEARVLNPAMHGSTAVPIKELMEELNAASPQEVSDMVHTVKRKLRAELREAVARTVEDPGDVDHELEELRKYLAFG